MSSALVISSGMVMAQGVPTVDNKSIFEWLEVMKNMETDNDTQVGKAQKRADIRTAGNQQLETLDKLIEAFEGQAASIVDYKARAGNEFPNAEQVYGPLANPAAGYVFGDARPDIEALIIAGSEQTYSHPGVAKAGLSPTQWRCLIQALIWQESRFNIGARSPADAFGLTQIIPGTAKQLGIYPEYYENPVLQVVGGATYLAQQLDSFDGNVIFALGAYNAGPGRIREYGGVPPFKETQHYVQVIPDRYNLYLSRVGGPDSLGTIDPGLYAVAEASLLSHGSIYYASHSINGATASLKRIRAMVEQIGKTEDVKDAYDLNSMIRAELIHIVSMRVRLKASRTKPQSALQQMLLTKQREASTFLITAIE